MIVDDVVSNALGTIVRGPEDKAARAARAAALIRTSGPFRWVGVYDVDHAAHEVRNLAWAGAGPPAHPSFPLDRGLTATAIATGRTVNAGNVRARAEYLPTLSNTASELIVPVSDDDGVVVGTVDVESGQSYAFEPLTQDAIEQYAQAMRPLWGLSGSGRGPRVVSDAARLPGPVTLTGRLTRLVPLQAAHAPALFARTHGCDGSDRLWRYMFEGPYATEEALAADLARKAAASDAAYLAILDGAGAAIGYASYMRIDAASRVIEVGDVLFSPELQGTTAATEAMYLMARHAFEDLGYRRYEWKCDALNRPSRRAARRFGFSFEGVFRQHMIRKGRNRDTAWFSMLDTEWPDRRNAFERWLDPANFDADGRQIRSLEGCRD